MLVFLKSNLSNLSFYDCDDYDGGMEITLWARILLPSAASVTSVKLSLEKRRPKTFSKLLE